MKLIEIQKIDGFDYLFKGFIHIEDNMSKAISHLTISVGIINTTNKLIFSLRKHFNSSINIEFDLKQTRPFISDEEGMQFIREFIIEKFKQIEFSGFLDGFLILELPTADIDVKDSI